ncbi:hypothetical protein APHMUC_0520 [Anaplasma phagocytophilum str. ApMUC09]|uniref:Uncharacterized protein n=1 Tax=Anaplasma phagocytophilum str. ApMUC09 TaxID=1359152 RepID=A0A0F3N7V3_ANAPH|nr:hypothetical protein APHMUC_0520 [Anaplasma phagocytophilum str. ApMUC09]
MLREAIPKFRNSAQLLHSISKSLSTCCAVFMFAHAKTHRYGSE